jgi:hypothetical protein
MTVGLGGRIKQLCEGVLGFWGEIDVLEEQSGVLIVPSVKP